MKLKLFIGVALGIWIFVPLSVAQSKNFSKEQRAVLQAVEGRWSDWKNDNLEGFLARHSPAWRRWSLRQNKLETRKDMEGFWQRAKSFEKTVSFEIQPIAIEIYGDGRFATAHFIALESVEFIKDRPTRTGENVPKDTKADLKLRFSDFLVKENGKWLVVGAYRDGSCAISSEFGRECTN